jgi:hypothetical protein
MHRGVGGDPPFPVRGPITALRVLEHRSEVVLSVSAVHAELTRQGTRCW